jgi:PTS system nitrogen regulatory IIA component
MNITEILPQNLILLNLKAVEKELALKEMSQAICESMPHLNLSLSCIHETLISRERMLSTGIGEGVAIPHAKVPGIENMLVCFGRQERGIIFEAIDHQPVYLIFLLLVPNNAPKAHLKALASISRLVKNPVCRELLLQVDNAQALYNALRHAEQNESIP